MGKTVEIYVPNAAEVMSQLPNAYDAYTIVGDIIRLNTSKIPEANRDSSIDLLVDTITLFPPYNTPFFENTMNLKETIKNGISNNQNRANRSGEAIREIQEDAHSIYIDARDYRNQRKDPLVLDLDGDGIETTNVRDQHILFDYDGTGQTLQATSGLGTDDGMLVIDINNNGTIDNGSELFSNFTQLSNGNIAKDGIEALTDKDTNQDGKINSSDTNFNLLKVWQDINQNGITETGELKSLSELNITELNVNRNGTSIQNGNQIDNAGTFTINGAEQQMADVWFDHDPFYNQFTDTLPVSEEAQELPDIQGMGAVRSLREAMTQSPNLLTKIEQFKNASTQEQKLAIIEEIMLMWADTGGLTPTMEQRFNENTELGTSFKIKYERIGTMYREDYLIGGNAGISGFDDTQSSLETEYVEAIQDFRKKVHILEALNGSYLYENPQITRQMGFAVSESTTTSSGGVGHIYTLGLNIDETQYKNISQAYAGFKDAIYGELILQTTLEPYLDKIGLVIDENGISFDNTELTNYLNISIINDNTKTIEDVILLAKYAGTTLETVGLDIGNILHTYLPQENISTDIQNLYDKYNVNILSQVNPSLIDNTKSIISIGDNSNETIHGGTKNDILMGGGGNDNMFGYDGDDTINGGGGNDSLAGGQGNDIINGNEGEDYLYGEAGNDTLNGGTGNDIMLGQSRFAVENIKFSDGELTLTEIKALTLIPTDGNDTLQAFTQDSTINGSLGDDTIYGNIGNDILNGNEGDDNIYGNTGNDTLNGADGNDYIYGGSGDDALNGNAGNDYIAGGSGNDSINGGNSDDTIFGDEGDDIIIGNYGDDYLIGGDGADTYIFNRGDGKDTIINYYYGSDNYGINADILQFGENITKADIEIKRSNNDLILNIKESTDKVTIKNYFVNNGLSKNAVENIKFSDNTEFTLEEIKTLSITSTDGDDFLMGFDGGSTISGGLGNDTINGNNSDDILNGDEGNDYITAYDGDDIINGGIGNDYISSGAGADIINGNEDSDSIYSGSGDDIITGNDGDDYLEGNDGADTYIFNAGDGSDAIYNADNDISSTMQDIIDFNNSISYDQLWFTHSGNDLDIRIIGTEDSIKVLGWYTNDNNKVDLIKASDEKVLVMANVDQLVQAMAAFAPPVMGQTTLSQEYQNSLNTVIAASWN